MTVRNAPRLIVNADDLGIHPEIDRGILRAFTDGIVTSTSALMTTPYIESALDTVSVQAGCPTGIHINLTMGRPLSDPADLPDLVDSTGEFRRTPGDFILLNPMTPNLPLIKAQIDREIRAQLEKGQTFDVPFTHLDSHQNIHLNPFVFNILTAAARDFGYTHIRRCREPFPLFFLTHRLMDIIRRKNPLKLFVSRALTALTQTDFKTTDRYFGMLYSGLFTPDILTRYLHTLRPGHSYELAIHPGFSVPQNQTPYTRHSVNAFLWSPDRRSELEAVTSGAVGACVQAQNIELISFKDI